MLDNRLESERPQIRVGFPLLKGRLERQKLSFHGVVIGLRDEARVEGRLHGRELRHGGHRGCLGMRSSPFPPFSSCAEQ